MKEAGTVGEQRVERAGFMWGNPCEYGGSLTNFAHFRLSAGRLVDFGGRAFWSRWTEHSRKNPPMSILSAHTDLSKLVEGQSLICAHGHLYKGLAKASATDFEK